MSWDYKKWGTASDPIHQSDLNNIASQNGCAKRYWYEKVYGRKQRELAAWQPTLGTGIHAVIERVIVADKDLTGVADDFLRRAILQEMDKDVADRGATGIDWRDDDIEKELAHGIHMIRGAVRTLREQCSSIVAVEEPFRVEIDGLFLEGTMDIVFRDRYGRLVLADWKTGKRKPDQVILDFGYQNSLYSHALHAGVIGTGDNERRLNERPGLIYTVHLRDFVPYEKKGKWGNVGDLRGPGWSLSKRRPDDFPRFQKSLKDIVRQVRMGIFTESLGEQCSRCSFKSQCLSEGEQLNTNDKRELDKSLRGLDLEEFQIDAA